MPRLWLLVVFAALSHVGFAQGHVVKRVKEMKTWKHKLAAIFYGPSWEPGKPRLGLEEDKIKVTPREKYDIPLSLWCKLYVSFHFLFAVYGFHELLAWQMNMSTQMLWMFTGCFMYSLIAIGMILDNHRYACLFETFRCLLLLGVIHRFNKTALPFNRNTIITVEIAFLTSLLCWLVHSVKVILQISVKRKRA